MSGNNPINFPTTTSYTPMPKYQPRTPGFQSTQIYSMTPTAASGRPQQGTYFREKSKTLFQSTMDFSSLSEPKSNPIPRSTYLSDNVSNQECNRTPADNASKLAVNHQLGRMRDAKMASSMIFTSNETETDFNRFPSFNLRNQQTVQTENQGNEGDSKQAAKQKRQRQIAAIKKQVESLNKKIQIKPLPNISLMDEMKPKQEPINISNNPRNVNNETTATSPYSFVPQKTRNQEGGKDVSGFQSGVGYRNNFLDSYKSDSTSLSSTKIWDDKPKSSSSSYNYPDPQSNKYNKPNYQKQPRQPTKQGMFLEPTASYEQYSFKKKNFSQQTSQPTSHQSPNYEYQPTSISINNNANFNISTAANVNTYTTASMNTHVNTNTSTSSTASNNDHNPAKNQMPKFKMSDFQVGKKMGKGQFGEVLLVRHKLTGWLCGLKVMDKKDIRSQGYVDQITRELSIQFYLQHRNIAQLYGYFEQGDKFYLLVQFCAGGHLLNQIRIQKRMNQEEVSKIIRQVCEGVDYIHKQQIIHRDIKPENILLNFDTVKICDFGWAVYRGFGMRKTASGSPLYYPPEIVKGEAYDDKIDIWNIGMMVYECLEGKIPFKIYSELDLNRIVQDEVSFPSYVDISEQAKDFILNTLKKNPDDRMQMRKMLRHPLLSKQKESVLSDQVLNQLRKVLE